MLLIYVSIVSYTIINLIVTDNMTHCHKHQQPFSKFSKVAQIVLQQDCQTVNGPQNANKFVGKHDSD